MNYATPPNAIVCVGVYLGFLLFYPLNLAAVLDDIHAWMITFCEQANSWDPLKFSEATESHP